MNLPRSFLVVLLAILPLGIAAPVFAQQGTAPDVGGLAVTDEDETPAPHYRVTVDTHPLDFVRALTRFPVVVTVEAIDRPVRGTLEVQVTNNPLLAARIEVEAPSLKRFYFYPAWGSVEGGFNPGLTAGPSPLGLPPPDVTVRLREGRTLRFEHENSVSPLQSGDRVIGELTSRDRIIPGLFANQVLESPTNGLHTRLLETLRLDNAGNNPGQFSGLSPSGDAHLESYAALIAPLPEDGYSASDGYSPLDIIALHGVDPRQWTPDRIGALQTWLVRGGVLLVWPTQTADWDPLFAVGLAPGGERVPSPERLPGDISALAEFIDVPFPDAPITERFPLPADFQTLVQAVDGAALLGVRQYGRGAIVMATVDLSLPLIRSWAGALPLLQWMASWGLNHSVPAHRAPGDNASAALQTATFRGFGGSSSAIPEDARLVLPLVHPAAGQVAFDRADSLVGLFAGYVLCVLALFPIFRKRRQWTLLWSVWGGFVVLSAAIWPLAAHNRTLHAIGEVQIASPGAISEVLRSELLVARRGSFDARETLRSLPAPTPFQAPAAVRSFANNTRVLPMEGGAYLFTNDYTLMPGEPAQLQHLQFPIWSRRSFYGVAPPAPPAHPFAVEFHYGEGLPNSAQGYAAEVTLQDDDFHPAIYWVAGRVGQDVYSGTQITTGRIATLKLDNTFAMRLGANSEVFPTTVRGQDIVHFRNHFGNPLEEDTGGFQVESGYGYYRRDTSVGEPLELDILAYTYPLFEWVRFNGGLAVAALEFPDPLAENPGPVLARLWYDPTPIPGDDRVARPLARLGYCSAGRLTVGYTGLGIPADSTVQWSTNQIWTPGEQIRLSGTANSVSITLEQYVPGRGWVPCPPVTSETLDDLAYHRADRQAMITGEALFRIRGGEGLALQQIVVDSSS